MSKKCKDLHRLSMNRFWCGSSLAVTLTNRFAFFFTSEHFFIDIQAVVRRGTRTGKSCRCAVVVLQWYAKIAAEKETSESKCTSSSS
ncbi:unnamed protein product [Amoebophrya sp. A120]|nr:unnamed protein product [Amoebophrya sp. A120]|eukprot:GSA120T00022173001.1